MFGFWICEAIKAGGRGLVSRDTRNNCSDKGHQQPNSSWWWWWRQRWQYQVRWWWWWWRWRWWWWWCQVVARQSLWQSADSRQSPSPSDSWRRKNLNIMRRKTRIGWWCDISLLQGYFCNGYFWSIFRQDHSQKVVGMILFLPWYNVTGTLIMAIIT